MTTLRAIRDHRQHPHGLIGYVLEDAERTRRSADLIRAVRVPLVLIVLLIAVAVVASRLARR